MTTQKDILLNNVEGDKITLLITFREQDGSLYDFTGVSKAWFTVKSNYDDTDGSALVALNSADHPTQLTYGAGGPGAGKAQVILLPDNTRDLAKAQHRYYDFQVLKGPDGISTLMIGEIKFVHEVTLASS